MSCNWTKVAEQLVAQPWTNLALTPGQSKTLCAIASRIEQGQRSVLIADEVGMGKTRIAAALASAVADAGGRVAAVIPPGIGSQWQKEIGLVDTRHQPLLPLRSIWTLLDAYRQGELANSENRRIVYERRRNQKELPEDSWAAEPILLLSHNLGRFQRTRKQEEYARRFLDQLRKSLEGKRRYIRNNHPDEQFARELADRLCGNETDAFRARLDACENGDIWARFQVLLGHALGPFDLVILDEAHKARRIDSSISRILSKIVSRAPDCLNIGLTATPIELENSQWISTLERLLLPPEKLREIKSVVQAYEEAITCLNRGPLTNSAVAKFESPARRMTEILGPWVLRRDQRDDEFIQGFVRHAKLNQHDGHRKRKDNPIAFGQMELSWKRAFLAMEALSLKRQDVSPEQRRLRLGLAAAVDADPAIFDEEKLTTDGTTGPWLDLLRTAGLDKPLARFTNPLLKEAVRLIEERTARGEKVLVFGRYNAPLAALTNLLDMRELVRRLNEPENFEWPQTHLSLAQKQAFSVAFFERGPRCEIRHADGIDKYLTEKYQQHENARRPVREQVRPILASLLSNHHVELDDVSLAALFRALEPHVDELLAQGGIDRQAAVKCAFDELLLGDNQDENGLTSTEAVLAYLKGFEGRSGHFASFLHGDVAAQTRRNLQLAFNRKRSWPRVLVAQSKVASEGLDLHTACRTILMFHPEWNPAICEQQIGRVDRLGSLWREMAADFAAASEQSGDAPQIEIIIPYVEGTYAEHNLRVLMTRWERLRAQLHGDIRMNQEQPCEDETYRQNLERVRVMTPSFRP